MEYFLLYIVIGLLLTIPVRKAGLDISALSYTWLTITWPVPLVMGVYKGVKEAGKKGANAPANAAPKAQTFAQAAPKIDATLPEVGTLTPAQEVLLNGLQIELHRAMRGFCAECRDKGQRVTPAALQGFLRQWIDGHLQPPRPRVNVTHDGKGGLSVDVDYCTDPDDPVVTREYKATL